MPANDRSTDVCRGTIVSRHGAPVQRIVLRLPAAFRFRPGQYLEVLHPGGPIPLSIASAPYRLPELHLHYLSNPQAPEASRMDELLDAGEPLEIRGPRGDVALPEPLAGDVLLAAGGTGMAQAMSFIDACSQAEPAAAVTLLWCAERDEHFYLAAELEALDAGWLRTVMIADAERSAANLGMRWLREQGGRFAAPESTVILSGGPGFVHTACDALLAAGVPLERMQSDVFSYAPRR